MKSIIQDYKHLKQNMIFLIERSGYKNSYLAEK